ncbi:MAG: hypothetical protein M1828_007307 [Chrysothrix sp. TS-e1954]|nr:MAG: hypothetical protein M1828_007307 [Chrysothrix sp. TS-e1954]
MPSPAALLLTGLISALSVTSHPYPTNTNTTLPNLTFTPYTTNHCANSQNPHAPSTAHSLELPLGACVTTSQPFASFVLGWPEDQETLLNGKEGCIVTVSKAEHCELGEGAKSEGLSGLSRGQGECVIMGIEGGSVSLSCGDVA